MNVVTSRHSSLKDQLSSIKIMQSFDFRNHFVFNYNGIYQRFGIYFAPKKLTESRVLAKLTEAEVYWNKLFLKLLKAQLSQKWN